MPLNPQAGAGRAAFLVSTLLGTLVVAGALAANEVEVELCAPAECPSIDPACCAPDTLEVVFTSGAGVDPDSVRSSILEYADFRSGMRVHTATVLETRSELVQGWSYGVRHDPAALALIEDSVTTDGTSTELRLAPSHFNATGAALGGWRSAVVLDLFGRASLPVDRRHTLARASYTLEADVGTTGTLIELAHRVVRISEDQGHPVAIHLSVDATSKLPRNLIQGLVRRRSVERCDNGLDDDGDGEVDCRDSDCPPCPTGAFRRGDADGDGRLGVADAVRILRAAIDAAPGGAGCADAHDADDDGRLSVSDALPVLAWAFLRGAALPEPFAACGVDPTDDALDCAQGAPSCAR